MTQNEMTAEIARLTAANAELKTRIEAGKKPGTLTLKISEKGGVSVYGLGRFPVTLYKEQWGRLLGIADQIKLFISTNSDKLTSKEDKAA